jgi:hypothetical protein
MIAIMLIISLNLKKLTEKEDFRLNHLYFV